MLFKLSLGSLGEKRSFLITLDPNASQSSISMYCNTGVIGSVSKFGYARANSNEGEQTTYDESTYCKLKLTKQN